MSTRGARRIVWLALVVGLPVPLALVGRGWMPAGAMVELAVATLAVGLRERLDGVLPTLVAVLLLQATVWAVVCWLGATIVVRGLVAVAPRSLGRATVALVVLAALLASAVPIYRSPFHATRAHQTLVEVY
jgi:hypothetical protein